MRGRKRDYPPLTAEQKALVEKYLSDGYKRVKQCIRTTLRRKVSPQEMDDYIGIAHLALMKAAACFNPSKRMSFTSFANLNICSAVKTELTRQNRDCRILDKQVKSLDAPLGNNEDTRIMDILVGDREVTIRETQQIQQYLAMLPERAKAVLRLRLSGLDYLTIRKKMGYDVHQMKDVLLALQQYERVSVLYKE